jgi:hypothetical protein
MASSLGKMRTTSVRRLNLTVEALERIDRVDFRSVILRESHEGEHVGFRLVHQRGELRHLGTQLIGHLAALLARRLGIVLREGRADEGGNDTPSLG